MISTPHGEYENDGRAKRPHCEYNYIGFPPMAVEVTAYSTATITVTPDVDLVCSSRPMINHRAREENRE